VSDGEVGAEQAEVLKMRGRRLAVAPETDHHLRLGFLDMGMQADREIAGKRRAFAHEIVGAMVWDGRRDRGPDGFTVLCPAFQCQPDRFQRCVAGRQPQGLHVFAQNRRHGVEQAGNGLKERELSDHRRQHGANAGVPIGPRARFETLNGRQRKLDSEVVARGAALEQHLERADIGAEIFVVGRAVAADPGRGCQQQFERPAIAHALGEIAVTVGVGVDQPGMQQAVARVERHGVGRCRQAGGTDLADGVANDQHIS